MAAFLSYDDYDFFFLTFFAEVGRGAGCSCFTSNRKGSTDFAKMSRIFRAIKKASPKPGCSFLFGT